MIYFNYTKTFSEAKSVLRVVSFNHCFYSKIVGDQEGAYKDDGKVNTGYIPN